MPTFQPLSYAPSYSQSQLDAVVGALVAPGSGLSVVASSITLRTSGPDTVIFYDGSLGLDPGATASVGAGLLLTSGGMPGSANTMEWFGFDNSGTSGFDNGDAGIDAVVTTVFQTVSYDATTLEFDFQLADPTATSVVFELVFGSDEYPEWVDQFVDSAIVVVNGVNYALFNHDPLHPLSVISSNLAAGYFQDNTTGLLPIEYDGISHTLQLVAPVPGGGGLNHLKIGIADTGDHILDSGVFIANLRASNLPGSGVVSPGASGTPGNDSCTGSAKDEVFDLKGGDDIVYAGGGDDIVAAGDGQDTVYGGSGADQLQGGGGDDWLDGGEGSDTAVYAGAEAGYAFGFDAATGVATLSAPAGSAEGSDHLTGIEYAQFSDGLYAITAAGLVPAGGPGSGTGNTPASVVITGIGAAGKTLNAVCSDADGVGASVSYQWLSSSDGGQSWVAIAGATGSSYAVSEADVGLALGVTASFTDQAGHAESATSAAKSINSANGDLQVTLMQLSAPPGATTINPLTTLVQAAMSLGQSPNLAAQAVKTMLGLPAGVNPLSYEAWPVLQASPLDSTSLQVEKIAVQVAILTSLSDDDAGLNLALALLDGAAAGHAAFDLARLEDLALILGVAPDAGLQPLGEILDRNKSMVEALADGEDWHAIEKEWQDLLSIQDGINSTSIADLSIHINQAPVGSAPPAFQSLQDQLVVLDASALLAGYVDPEGSALELVSLAADQGSVVYNPDGTWTYQPPAGYTGPVEWSFVVGDAEGGLTAGTTMLVIEPVADVNHPAQGLPVIEGSAVEDQVLSLSLAGISDADGLPASYDIQWTRDGLPVSGATGSTYQLSDADVGASLAVELSFVDAKGHAEWLQSAAAGPVANVDDEASGTVLVTGLLQAGATLSADTSSLADLDGSFVCSYQWQQATAGGWVDLPGATTATLLLPADQSLSGLPLRVLVQTLDVLGGSTDFQSAAVSVPLVDLKLVGGAVADSLTGAGGNDTLLGQGGNDRLLGQAGDDLLLGGTGVDVMDGGDGSDRYLVMTGNEHAAAEIADSGTAAGDIDELRFAATKPGRLVLHAGDTGLERIVLGAGMGPVADCSGTWALDVNASALGNGVVIVGNAGSNNIVGSDFADTLCGHAGADALSGGDGADRFVFDTLPAHKQFDKITDFVAGVDRLVLVTAGFAGLGTPGPLNPALFHSGWGTTTAHDADDRLIYNTKTGALYYDGDGTGPVAPIEIALLGSKSHPLLASSDFELVLVGP